MSNAYNFTMAIKDPKERIVITAKDYLKTQRILVAGKERFDCNFLFFLDEESSPDKFILGDILAKKSHFIFDFES